MISPNVKMVITVPRIVPSSITTIEVFNDPSLPDFATTIYELTPDESERFTRSVSNLLRILLERRQRQDMGDNSEYEYSGIPGWERD